MSFSQGDILWVPIRYIDPNSQSSYWPAQFARPTNIIDIINVFPYGPQGILKQQFVVDTKDVLGFQDYTPKTNEPQLAEAFERAMQDYKNKVQKQIAPKYKPAAFSSAEQLARFLEDFCMDQLLDNNQGQQVSIFNSLSPEFNIKDISVDQNSLKIYFRRRTTQILSCLAESNLCKITKNDKKNLLMARDKIVKAFMKEIEEKGHFSNLY